MQISVWNQINICTEDLLDDGDVDDEDDGDDGDDDSDDDDDDNAQEDLLDDGDNPLEDHLLWGGYGDVDAVQHHLDLGERVGRGSTSTPIPL